MSTTDVYAAEIVVYDPAIPGERTITVATVGFATSPTDTPANVVFDAGLTQSADFARHMYAPGATSGVTQSSWRTVDLLNGDGAFDDFAGYYVDGRPITIRRGPVGGAYPADFETVFRGTMLGVDLPANPTPRVSITVAQRGAELTVPIQPTKYAGTNVLPDGEEGTDDIAGQPKPIVFGPPFNCTAKRVNTAKEIWQINDGALEEISEVRDEGIELEPGFQWSSVNHGLGATSFFLCIGLVPDNGSGAGPWFVIGGLDTAGGGAAVVAYSNDAGHTWTLIPINTPAGRVVAGFAWDPVNDVLVVVGGDGGLTGGFIQTTTAPLTAFTVWADQVSPFGTDAINSIAVGNGIVIITSDAGGVASSADGGVTWTVQTVPAAVAGAKPNVSFAHRTFILSLQQLPVTDDLFTSEDGVLWTPRVNSIGFISGRTYRVNGFYVNVGASLRTSEFAVLVSEDALTWTLVDDLSVFSGLGYATEASAVVAAFGLLILFGFDNESVAVTRDGSFWEEIQGATPGFFFGAPTGTSRTQILDAATDGTFLVAIAETNKVLLASRYHYASLADLENDAKAPAPGHFIAHLDSGLFRLGTTPIGQITCDPIEGSSSGQRSAGQIWLRIMERAGLVAGTDFSGADVTALDALTVAEQGLFIDAEMAFAAALSAIAASVGAWWGPDRTGLYRLQRLDLPSGPNTFSIGPTDIKGRFQRLRSNDPLAGIPAYQSIVRYGRNYTVQGQGLAGGVAAENQILFSQDAQSATSTDLSVQAAHALAQQIIDDSLIVEQADAATEATRRQVIRGALRPVYPVTIELNDETESIDLGDVGLLTHPKYGFAAGKQMRVIGVEPNASSREVTLFLWGAAA